MVPRPGPTDLPTLSGAREPVAESTLGRRPPKDLPLGPFGCRAGIHASRTPAPAPVPGSYAAQGFCNSLSDHRMFARSTRVAPRDRRCPPPGTATYWRTLQLRTCRNGARVAEGGAVLGASSTCLRHSRGPSEAVGPVRPGPALSATESSGATSSAPPQPAEDSPGAGLPTPPRGAGRPTARRRTSCRLGRTGPAGFAGGPPDDLVQCTHWPAPRLLRSADSVADYP